MLSLFSNRIRKYLLEKELIRLAKNLYDIGMNSEADEIMILAANSYDHEGQEGDTEDVRSNHPIDDLESIISTNSNDDDFVYSIADILINHLNEDSLREISESISEAIE